jgi:serine protease inhibitor
MHPYAPPASGFGLRVLAELGGGNAVLSPLGLQLALATLRAGASGPARAALDEVLGEPPPIHDLPAEVAQALWLDTDLQPGPALAAAAAELGVEVDGLDFGDPAAVATVNRGVAEHTHGMIETILDRFDSGERLVLAGAAYFKGLWSDPFDPADTAPAPFTTGDGRVVEVPMMARSARFDYDEERQAVRLPYSEGLAFVLALRGLPGGGTWRPRQGRVRMPRLALQTRLDLRRALEGLGLGLLFEPGPDLAGLFAGPAADTALGRVLQSARLEVDEAGTRAAAATAVTAVLVSAAVDPPFELVADRPFTWAIEHAASGTLLFAGVVDDPTREESD